MTKRCVRSLTQGHISKVKVTTHTKAKPNFTGNLDLSNTFVVIDQGVFAELFVPLGHA